MGIINKAQQPQAAQQPQGQQGQPVPGEQSAMGSAERETQASPGEQKVYDEVVNTAMMLMYDEANLPNMMETLQKGEPPEAIAQVAVMLVSEVEKRLGDTKKRVPDGILVHAGIEIIEQLIEMGEEAKLFDISEDQQEEILFRALELWGQNNPERMEEKKGEMESMFNQIPQQEAEGIMNQTREKFLKQKPVAEGVSTALGEG